MRRLTMLLCVLVICATSAPAQGAALGVGAGLLGTDAVGVVHFRSHSLIEKFLKFPPFTWTQVLAVGIASGETGFLNGHGLSNAFLGAGYRFGLGKEDSTSATSRYVTALLMAFPDDPDDGANAGGAVHFGIQRATTFSSGFPGGYFAEVGTVACKEFVTVSIQVGIYAGK